METSKCFPDTSQSFHIDEVQHQQQQLEDIDGYYNGRGLIQIPQWLLIDHRWINKYCFGNK